MDILGYDYRQSMAHQKFYTAREYFPDAIRIGDKTLREVWADNKKEKEESRKQLLKEIAIAYEDRF